ncbi:MAG TPA: cytochrome c oxidase accessory protein CcoG [Polyangiaceae bacterium]|nr:cytochrome c oxidase accessory protein CcoG [Polyangiaceae bacterium]
MTHLPVLNERVLPTLNQDGSRLRIRPQLFRGATYKQRFWVAWGLMVLFVALPFVRVKGKPAILLDIVDRQFVFFGATFLATDGVVLMLLLLSIFVAIILITALVGRAWCGWGCPQTVYMEFLFRPIERLFEGDRNAQLRLDRRGGGGRRLAKNVVFALLSVVVANVFLAYFVGTHTLFNWVRSSPFQHPSGFVVMGVTAGLVFFDFAYFREQMCTVACPYARLQAALFDKNSLIIGYKAARGEPRKKGKERDAAGDCVDCDACVRTCPTGIDIRDGLQLECIACAQCIDACNFVMEKVKLPPNLIAYSSQRALGGERGRVLRPRVIAYCVLLLVLSGALVGAVSMRRGADITVLRGIGAPYVLDDAGVRNQVRLKIENRGSEGFGFGYQILVGKPGALRPASEFGIQVISPENPMHVKGGGRATTSLFVVSPRTVFRQGRLPIVVRVELPDGTFIEQPYHLLGPEGAVGQELKRP